MGVAHAFELTKDCKAIKLVDPQKEGPCEIDGSAVSYMRFKTTEGRLLLKQLKKMAKEDTSIGVPGPVLRLAHLNQESWSLPSPLATKGLASDLSALHLSTTPNSSSDCNTSTDSATTQLLSTSSDLLHSSPALLPAALPLPSHPPKDLYHDLNSARDVVWPLVANVLNKMFDGFYKKSEDFIHYDGPPTTQKAFAHERRQLATKKQIFKLFEYLRIAEARLSQMEEKPNLSNRQVSRFKSFLSKVLFPCWIGTRGVDPRATRAIVSELRESHGWKTHMCAGQFDICVGRKARENPGLVVVSTDSDLMFLGAERLFRFQSKGGRFYCYPIASIIRHCGLETSDEWVAAAVVSLNDYDPSVGRTSFSTATKDVSAIRKDWHRKKGKDRPVEDYVKELCKRKKVHHDVVKKSLDSFVHLVETPLGQHTEGDDEIDESIRRIIYRVEALTLRCRSPWARKRPSQRSLNLTPINSTPVQLPTTDVNDNVVEMLALPQLQSRLSTTPHVTLPVARMVFPVGAARNVESANVRNHATGLQRYATGHKYRPKAFTSAFTSQHKNMQPISVKDKTIGRTGSTASVLIVEGDNDYECYTFPDDADISDGAAMVNLPAPLAAPVEDSLSLQDNTADGHQSEVNSDNDSDNSSDDNSDNNSDNNSDDSSGNEDDYEGNQQTEDQPIDSKRPKKRVFKKITYAKSSRRARDADEPLNEKAVARKINPTNLIADVVASLHPMRAMRPGRIESCLTHSLKESFPCPSDQDRSLLSGYILDTIGTMARVNTDLLREGLMVTNLCIARTFGKFPATDGDRGREHGDKRKEHFSNILLKGKRETFFQRLLRRLIRWDSKDSDLPKASSPAMVASDEIFLEYLQITSQRQAPPFRVKDRDVCEASFLSQCARTLSDMVGGHLYKFPLELKKRALVHNPSWASSENGKTILDSIDNTTGRSQEHDCVSIHLLLNLILPAKAQIQILPQIGYEDGFFSFTERQLVRCLLKDFTMDRKNNKIKPIAKRMRLLSSAEQEKQRSLANTLVAVFGSKMSADTNTQDEVGRLSFLLFLNGKNTSYRRGANLLWVKDNCVPASSSSSSSPSPSPPSALQKKDLKAKVIFSSGDATAIKEARRTLEEMDAKDARYASSKVEFKELIRQSLQRPEQYQEQIDKSEPGQPRQKYVLTGDFSIDGHDLRVMAYKLTESRRSTRPTTMTDTGIASSGSAIPESALPSPTEETRSKSPLLNDDRSSAHSLASTEGQAPGGELLAIAPVTSSPVPTSSTVFPWSTAPTIQGWTYVSKKFDSQEKVESFLQSTNGQAGIRSLCIDPGIASTGTATLIHSCYEKDNINLSIPRGPRDDIDRRYRKQQSRIKIDAGITEIEGRLMQRKPVEARLVVGDSDVSMDSNSGTNSDSQDTIALFTEAVQDYESAVMVHLVNVANEASTLRSFYGSARFKQDRFDYREALRHDLDKAITAILRMRKYVPDRQPTDEDLEKVLHQLDEDIESSMAVVDGSPNAKKYDWTSYLGLMDEVKKRSGSEREALLKSKSSTRRLKKIARSLYKRGFL